MRAYRKTWPYKKALSKRKVWVEPLFVEAKEWHGMRRFRLRRLRKVNMEVLMVAYEFYPGAPRANATTAETKQHPPG